MATKIDTEQAGRIRRNMALTRRFSRLAIADPTILDDIPDGATLFLVPDGDVELARLNLDAAERARQAGHVVHVRRLDATSASESPDGGDRSIG